MKLRIIFPSVLLAVIIAILIISLDYSYVTKMFPFVVGVPLIALVAAQLLREIRTKEAKPETMSKEIEFTATNIRSSLVGPSWIAVLLLLLYLVGYLVGIPLFLFLCLKLRGTKWLTTIIVSVVAVAILAVFIFGLETRFYQGLLFSLFS